MNRFKDKNILYIAILTLIILVSFILMYGKAGSLIIDCGREAYFPLQVYLGKVLYKDIINIYGPFTYMFNAMMYKLFGINLSVLYFCGLVGTFVITISTYLLAKRFISAETGFVIALMSISTGMYSFNVFNTVFPYSYAMLYGTATFLLSLVFLFRKNKYDAYIAAMFAGISVLNKYDFVLYIPIFIFAVIKLYKPDLKQMFLTFLSFISFPFICFSILFWQGLRIEDITRSLKIVSYLSQTDTLAYFYSQAGLLFRKEHFIVWGKQIFNLSIAVLLFSSALNSKNKIIKLVSFVLMIVFIKLAFSYFCFSFIPILTLVMFLLMFKKTSLEVKLLLLSIWGATLKTFLGLSLVGYGVFYIGIVLLGFIVLLPKKYIKEYTLFLLILSIIFGVTNYSKLNKFYKITTPRGTIYTEKVFGEVTDSAIKYINEKTKPTDKILIYPEGQLINFLTDRQSDNLVYSLIPLYVETFGEKNIIHRLTVTKPEYIFINNWNTKDYLYEELCGDYGLSICNYIKTNYKKDVTIGNVFKMSVYKRNDL